MQGTSTKRRFGHPEATTPVSAVPVQDPLARPAPSPSVAPRSRSPVRRPTSRGVSNTRSSQRNTHNMLASIVGVEHVSEQVRRRPPPFGCGGVCRVVTPGPTPPPYRTPQSIHAMAVGCSSVSAQRAILRVARERIIARREASTAGRAGLCTTSGSVQDWSWAQPEMRCAGSRHANQRDVICVYAYSGTMSGFLSDFGGSDGDDVVGFGSPV